MYRGAYAFNSSGVTTGSTVSFSGSMVRALRCDVWVRDLGFGRDTGGREKKLDGVKARMDRLDSFTFLRYYDDLSETAQMV